LFVISMNFSGFHRKLREFFFNLLVYKSYVWLCTLH
jgi:hypothetical protein